MPGLNKLDYTGAFWPDKIESLDDEETLSWIESHLWLVPLYPRKDDFDVYEGANLKKEGAKALSEAAVATWSAVQKKDILSFGKSITDSFYAQISLFPNMVSDDIWEVINRYKDDVYGWKISGAGGGGYVILVSDKSIENAIQIRIRRG